MGAAVEIAGGLAETGMNSMLRWVVGGAVAMCAARSGEGLAAVKAPYLDSSRFRVRVGPSSEELRLKGEFEVASR